MNDHVTLINRIVEKNPSLQRLRDVATSLYLNDLQVENLVNEIVRFQNIGYRYMHPGWVGPTEMDSVLTHIQSVSVVNKQVTVVGDDMTFKGGISTDYILPEDLLLHEYLFLYVGPGLMGYYAPEQATDYSLYKPDLVTTCRSFGLVSLIPSRAAVLYSPVQLESPIVSNGPMFFVADNKLERPNEPGWTPLLSFNYTGVKVKFGFLAKKSL